MMTYDHHDDHWEEHHPETDAHHLELRLEDPDRDGHASKLLHCHVDVSIKKDGVSVDTGELVAVYGDHGFHYGGNFALAEAGDYEIEVHAGVPEFARGESVKNRWRQESEFHFNYAYNGNVPDDEVSIGETETVDVKIEVEAEKPERLWILDGGTWGWQEPDGNATHYLKVVLEDPLSEAHHETIGYCEVHIEVVNEANGEGTGELELHPMYSEHGFHFGANTHFPHAAEHAEGDHHDDGGGHGH
jgi:uncharacterized protein involved in high-affinity Fe2+ transport